MAERAHGRWMAATALALAWIAAAPPATAAAGGPVAGPQLVGPPGFASARGWRGSPLLELPGPVLPLATDVSRLGPLASLPVSAASPAGLGPPPATWQGWLPSLLLAGAFAGVQFGLDPPDDSRWTDRNGFDSAVRRALRGGSRSTRKGAATASDALFGVAGAALALDWWLLRDEWGLLRSIQVDTRYFLGNNVTTRIAKVAAGRQRPYVQPCGRDSDYVPWCGNGRDDNDGFFSGHASNVATLAGLLCARHLGRRDPGLGDAFVCGGAAAGALTVGALRIVSEHHFATDVLAGWATGAVFGYMLPRALDYGGDPGGALGIRSFAPVIGRDYYGFQYGFRF